MCSWNLHSLILSVIGCSHHLKKNHLLPLIKTNSNLCLPDIIHVNQTTNSKMTKKFTKMFEIGYVKDGSSLIICILSLIRPVFSTYIYMQAEKYAYKCRHEKCKEHKAKNRALRHGCSQNNSKQRRTQNQALRDACNSKSAKQRRTHNWALGDACFNLEREEPFKEISFGWHWKKETLSSLVTPGKKDKNYETDNLREIFFSVFGIQQLCEQVKLQNNC